IDNLPDTDGKVALQSLPEDYRFAVFLVDVEGFSYQETAEIMKTPQGTVMSRLHRGRKLLREALNDYAIERGIICAGGEKYWLPILNEQDTNLMSHCTAISVKRMLALSALILRRARIVPPDFKCVKC